MKNMKLVVLAFMFCFTHSSFALEQKPGQVLLDSLDFYLDEAKSYTHYENRSVFHHIDRLIVNGVNQYGMSKKIEKRLIRFLKTGASLSSKQMICFQISVHGSKSSIKPLEKLLKSPETFDIALFALERLPDKAADKALIKYLKKSADIGVINTLGRKRSEKALSVLKSLITHSDGKIRRAAIRAIGEISGKKALEVLQKGRSKTTAAEKSVYSKAMLICAGKLLESEQQTQNAISTYKILTEPSESKSVRNAAFIGLVNSDKNKASDLIYDAITKRDKDLIASAIALIPTACSSENMQMIAKLLPSLEPIHKVQLYSAFIAAGNHSVTENIVTSLEPANDELTKAGVAAISQLGDSSHVATLLHLVIEHPRYEKVVLENLAVMKGRSIDRAMLNIIGHPGTGGQVQFLIMQALADRLTSDIEEQLIAHLNNVQDNQLRREIIKTLGAVSQPSYFLPIFEFLFQTKNSIEMRELEKTLAFIARKMSDSTDKIQIILTKYEAVNDKELQGALLGILGRIGNSEAIPVIENALSDPSYRIRKAAYHALSVWPTTEPLNQLLSLADSTTDRELKSIALHGYVRMIPNLSELAAEEKLTHYQTALDKAVTINDKQIIFAGMSGLPTIASLDVLDDYLDDPGTKRYAVPTIVEIIKNSWRQDRAKVRVLLQKMRNESRDEELLSFIKLMLTRIDE